MVVRVGGTTRGTLEFLRRIVALALWLVALGCGGTPTPQAARSDQHAEAIRCELGKLPIACDASARVDVLPSRMAPVSSAEHPTTTTPPFDPVVAGQMTPEAAIAKRAFDQERWTDAAGLLLATARGEHGDDLGNRQLAEYYWGVSLFRLGRYTSTADVMSRISTSEGHLKADQSLLWLSKLVDQDCLTEPVFEAIGQAWLRSRGTTRCFASREREQRFDRVRFLAAVWLARRGHRDAAARLFERLEASATLGREAERCSSKLLG